MTTHRTVLTRAAWLAVFSGETPCDACNGTGRIPRVGKRGTRACPACRGKGVQPPQRAVPRPNRERRAHA